VLLTNNSICLEINSHIDMDMQYVHSTLERVEFTVVKFSSYNISGPCERKGFFMKPHSSWFILSFGDP